MAELLHPRPRSRTKSFDRFIPNRAAMDFEFAHFKMTMLSPTKSTDVGNDSGIWSPKESRDAGMDEDMTDLKYDDEEQYTRRRGTAFSTALSDQTGNDRILQFRPRSKSDSSFGTSKDKRDSVLAKLGMKTGCSEMSSDRFYADTPESVISLPEHPTNLIYHNLTHSNDRVGFGLGTDVIIWNVTLPASQAFHLSHGEEGDITSVAMNNEGDRIAFGRDSDGVNVEIYDVESNRQLSKAYFEARVYDFAWTTHGISLGKEDGNVAFYDLRREFSKETLIYQTTNGDQPVSITYSLNSQYLVSGDAEGTVALWEQRMTNKTLWEVVTQHGPVTKIAWCPWHSHLLATAGIVNEAQGSIRILNTLTGAKNKSKDIPAAVTGLEWYPSEQELISSHNGPFESVVFWNPTSMIRSHALRDGHPVNDMVLMSNLRIVCMTTDEMKVWSPNKSNRSAATGSSTMRARAKSTTLRKSIFKMNMIR